MKLTSFLIREAIQPALKATTRDAAIAEMIRSLHTAGKLPGADLADITAAVLRREQLGSTGIGRGIAIPHSRHRDVPNLVGTVALAPSGLAFDSIDGEPVQVLFLLISPDQQPGPHLRALEAVVQKTKDDSLLAKLRSAKTADEIWELL
jgi:PTS system fructose-specific IIA component/PTS system nitrogen regulatory IIA component